MRIIKFLLLAAITAAVVVFSIYNRTAVAIIVPFTDFILDVPLYLLIFTIFIAGVITGGLIALAKRVWIFFELSEKDKKIKALENEVSGLRIQKEIVIEPTRNEQHIH